MTALGCRGNQPGPGSRPVPRWLWVLAALAPTAVWFLMVKVDPGSLFLDWTIYRQGFGLWQSIGSPYVLLPAGWNPCETFPYLYPPTSWLLMPLSAVLPPIAAGLGILPLLLRPPRWWFVPIAAAFLIIGLGPALYLGNANALVAGLIVLSFVPGPVGGLAFGLVVGIKLYPIVLLPLLWGDRSRLKWFTAVLGGLALTGTVFFGVRGWIDFGTTLLNEGPHCGISWNPFADLGIARIAPAGLILIIGLALRSPTISLIGATWFSGVVTEHYFVTFAAALVVEPPLDATIGRLRTASFGLRLKLNRWFTRRARNRVHPGSMEPPSGQSDASSASRSPQTALRAGEFGDDRPPLLHNEAARLNPALDRPR